MLELGVVDLVWVVGFWILFVVVMFLFIEVGILLKLFVGGEVIVLMLVLK